MTLKREQRVTVLSGDLIASTQHQRDHTEKALRDLDQRANRVAGWQGQSFAYFSRFRGDGWQIVLYAPEHALRATLYLHAYLRIFKILPATRISIGLGQMDPWDGGDLSTASGSAFEASGRGLDNMPKSRRFMISGDGVTPLHHAIIAMVEDQAFGWSPEQAEAISRYLLPNRPTLKDIAQDIEISTQAVHARISGAHGQTLRQTVELWEEYERNHHA
ncbi:hypothetical protein [Aliiroseovarius crassostreae]|uniref:hypothetical protein n=1 Tax=Aliiroseovarius crassostreae TaxID=154981 RepID=UPI002203869F|nr:hypothetical protein [Aliiroseovarius crassostreae]UWP90001.1 hypothetical protein K3J57_04755 [Aliiroseovarius crassostreae]